jgi:ABC-type nitrate/sulfonate/bicarbonate transport system substrate-binding protein
MDRSPALRRLAAALTVAALLAAASCGSSGGSTTVTAEAGAPAQDPGPRQDPVRIRLALAPDPLWEWLKASGTVAQWEADRNIRIEASSPFDQFAAFAGGHADMVVISALDVPQFVEQTDREPAVIGKYTTDRSILAVRRTSRAEDLADLVESRIAVESALGSTLLWGLIAESLHGLDFRVDGSDFDLVVVDAASVADLVMRGDVDACICLPDASVPFLAEGTMKPLYGGRSGARIYAEDVAGDPAALPISDVFLIDRAWHEHNEYAVESVLELWETGLQHWRSHRPTVIADFPHLFTVVSDEEVSWITDYADAHDWVFESVFITEEEAAANLDVFWEMRRVGLIDEDAALPDIDTAHSGPGGHEHSDDSAPGGHEHSDDSAPGGHEHSDEP